MAAVLKPLTMAAVLKPLTMAAILKPVAMAAIAIVQSMPMESIIQLLLDTHQVAVVAEVCKRTLHTARMTSGTALQKATKVTEWCKLGLL